MFRPPEKDGSSSINVNNLFVDGWSPGGAVNGTNSVGWGKRDDMKEAAGPDICWDHEGSVNPIAMQEMTEEEKEVHLTLAMSACEVIAVNVDCLGFFHICQLAVETPNTEP